MVEGEMNHAIGARRAILEAIEILERSADDLGAGIRQRGCLLLLAAEAEHLMAGCDQLGDKGRADEAGSASNKNTHERVSSFVGDKSRLSAYAGKVVILS